MKKFIYLALLLIAVKAEAQQAVTFKIKYLPNHNYDGTVSMNLNCNLSLKGDTQILAKLKSQGITPPLALTMDMTMLGNTKTGASDAKGIFPLSIDYKVDQMNLKIGSNPIPMPAQVNSGVIIYGHAGADGKLKADSIGGPAGAKLKDTSEKNISKMMNSIQTMIKFPDNPMHVGDSFTQDMPLNIPMAGNTMAANAKAVYKLTSIADGNAYFDVTQSMDMTIPIKGESITLTGSGTGKLVFDLKNSFATDYKTDINLKFSGKISSLEIDGTAALGMDYKYVIK